jgi:hypothetical protein
MTHHTFISLYATLQLLCFVSSLCLSTTNTKRPFGVKIARDELQTGDEKPLYENYPVVIKNAFHMNNEAWANDLVDELGELDIEYDVRDSESGEIESYEASFVEFLESLPESSDHYENAYMMNENIMNNNPAIRKPFKSIKTLSGSDLFDCFPNVIRPKSALIAGGVGSRSFLHADPYEWMGWNYLVEGRKLWTFFPPSVSPEVLKARRNPPDAWGKHNISAGWVSDVDLYRYRYPDGINLNTLVSKLDKIIAQEEREDAGEKPSILSTLNRRLIDGLADEPGSIMKDAPVFLSGDTDVDHCADEAFSQGAIQFIQEEGDLVMIPPFWWHQVYHLEPSIGVASQYFNERGKNQVFSHILEWCASGKGTISDELSDILTGCTYTDEEVLKINRLCGEELLPSCMSMFSEEDQVESVIRAGIKLQHGIKGDRLIHKLYRDS